MTLKTMTALYLTHFSNKIGAVFFEILVIIGQKKLQNRHF